MPSSGEKNVRNSTHVWIFGDGFDFFAVQVVDKRRHLRHIVDHQGSIRIWLLSGEPLCPVGLYGQKSQVSGSLQERPEGWRQFETVGEQ